MFSKSDSLKLFTVVTVTSVIVFFLLSYDTLQKIPVQTNSKNITSDVIRGKHIWESNNCMGCHTLFGEGAYYAPDLTKVYTRRSENFIKIFLNDPNAMYPGKRKMVSYKFSDKEIEDLISFFKWWGAGSGGGKDTRGGYARAGPSRAPQGSLTRRTGSCPVPSGADGADRSPAPAPPWPRW